MADGGRAHVHGERQADSHLRNLRSRAVAGACRNGAHLGRRRCDEGAHRERRGREDVHLRGMRPDQDRAHRQAPADGRGQAAGRRPTRWVGGCERGLRSGRRAGRASPDGRRHVRAHRPACSCSATCFGGPDSGGKKSGGAFVV